jgi:hypothetical protein
MAYCLVYRKFLPTSWYFICIIQSLFLPPLSRLWENPELLHGCLMSASGLHHWAITSPTTELPHLHHWATTSPHWAIPFPTTELPHPQENSTIILFTMNFSPRSNSFLIYTVLYSQKSSSDLRWCPPSWLWLPLVGGGPLFHLSGWQRTPLESAGCAPCGEGVQLFVRL